MSGGRVSGGVGLPVSNPGQTRSAADGNSSCSLLEYCRATNFSTGNSD